MDILLIRFDAPIMSFGAPIVDQKGVIQPFPGLSMICGMLGNALGYHHRDSELLERLQQRLFYAVRQDRRGKRLQDYQTVALGQEFMLGGWTTRGEMESRGGASSAGTHIRFRDYFVDAIYTIALTMDPQGEEPGLDRLAQALQKPERPIFIGRKPCIPARDIFLERREGPSLIQSLKEAELAHYADDGDIYAAWWHTLPHLEEPDVFKFPVTDARDWQNQVHVGERWMASGQIRVNPKEPNENV